MIVLLVSALAASAQQVMAKILAFDQASRTSGYSVFDNGKLISYGKFTYDDSDFGVRLYKIREKVKSLIEEHCPDEVIFEDIQLQANVGNNVDTFKKLAEVFGVIYELVTEKNIPNQAVLASVWKSTLGVKGRDRAAQKANAQKYVLQEFGVKATQDECDAICIGAHAVKKSAMSFDWSE